MMNSNQMWFGIIFTIICCCSVKESHGKWPNECYLNGIIQGEICYIIKTSPVSYSSAVMTCLNLNGSIAMMKSSSTQMLIAQQMRKNGVPFPIITWAGITDKVTEGKFVYDDNEQLGRFKPWGSNQPNGKTSIYSRQSIEEDCVSFNYEEEWHDEECSVTRYYACQFKRDNIPCKIQHVYIPHAEYESCYTTDEFPYKKNLSIKCHEGYTLVGSNNITCLEDGKWSVQPQCMQGCEPPKLPLHASTCIPNLIATYPVGSQVVHVCKDGYITNNQRSHLIQTCNSNSKWVPETIGCVLYDKYKIGTIEVERTTSISLPCNSSEDDQLEKLNNTETNYLWLKNSEDIATTNADYTIDDNGTLLINNMSENAVGQYLCFRNDSQLIPASLGFDLKLTPDVCPQSRNNTEKVSLQEGASAVLKCPHNTSDHDFTWYKDGKRYYVRNDQTLFPDGTLYTKTLKYYDQGIYTCQMREKETHCERNHTIEVKIIALLESICGNADPEYPHPWVVSLWQKDEIGPFCYGTLIHESWVVTSAQCLAGFNRKRNLHVSVRLSYKERDIFIDDSDSSFVNHEVHAVKIHPKFYKKVYVNDIGLLQLKNPIHFTRSVRPICVTETELTLKQPCDGFSNINGTVVGWGPLEKDNFELVDMMMNESMFIVSSRNSCFTGDQSYFDKIVCAKKNVFSRTTFAADAGSPFEIVWKDQYYLLGIYSWGERAALMGDHDYFTKVSDYISWLKGFIEESEAVPL